MIKGQKDQGSRSQWGWWKRRSSSKSNLLISLSMRRYHHRENWVSVLWALPQACKHPGPRIWGSPGRPTVDTASCPPLRKLQAELQLMDYFMNSETTVMSQVPRNLFHHSKHNPTKTQILRMGEEKWWFSRRGFVKEYAFYYKKKKKNQLFEERMGWAWVVASSLVSSTGPWSSAQAHADYMWGEPHCSLPTAYWSGDLKHGSERYQEGNGHSENGGRVPVQSLKL